MIYTDTFPPNININTNIIIQTFTHTRHFITALLLHCITLSPSFTPLPTIDTDAVFGLGSEFAEGNLEGYGKARHVDVLLYTAEPET
jgi:hypothetical protein